MMIESMRIQNQTMLWTAITLMIVGTPCIWARQKTNSEQSGSGTPLKSITIHQEVDFNASPQRIYEALLDSKQFTAFSTMPAEINRELGGAFSVFGGHIIGRNVELIPNKRIVQAWRVVDWPEGIYSIAKFELKPQGSGTHLVFDHTGFPEELRDHLAAGWEEHYWSLLKKYLH